jgi:hypothetical protein
LGPRIHGRNARFYAPGFAKESGELGECEMRSVKNSEMSRIDLKEVRGPGKVVAKWRREMGV